MPATSNRRAATDQPIATSPTPFLTEWLAVVKNTVGAGTFERYEQYIRVHAIPALGRIRLGRLTHSTSSGSTRKGSRPGYPPPRSVTCTPCYTAPSPRLCGGACYQEMSWRSSGHHARHTSRPSPSPSSRPERSWPPRLAIGLKPCSSWRSRPACAAASCLRCAGTTSTSTRACFRSAARFLGPAKGSPSALQRPQHPGAR
jgi:hypothetical protein